MSGIKTVGTTSRIIVWASSPEIVRLVARIAKLLQIEYVIPNAPPSCGGRDIIIVERGSIRLGMWEHGSRCRVLYVDPTDAKENTIGTALSIVKALWRVREASIGIDVGATRIAYAVLAAGSVLLAGVEANKGNLLANICSALRTHRELVAGIGASPAVYEEALSIRGKLLKCSERVYLVDEYESNIFRAYGLKGASDAVNDDVLAAIQIALRVYTKMHRVLENTWLVEGEQYEDEALHGARQDSKNRGSSESTRSIGTSHGSRRNIRCRRRIQHTQLP
ncbi:hypothetical protein [Hyperthermus butylicus]|uniref:Uncharacterized protein n=1 Tax=Hyperthermus butylicus (strain DSM 5456 / JCM 9403 / PLM1-5) TaxID=415426 RepID=A2BN90_HYPBU|nr:hypothetical protein [Hyperthermus butylicus]ABM81451.1 hypothetical protein Hbut_1637 [Hyperthermus butylicus DSM 5456]